MTTRMMPIALCTILMVAPAAALAAQPETALDGYCPVCLVKMDKLVKGNPKFASVFDGKTYLFPSDEQKRMFDANPVAFVPALGGDCAVCKVEMNKFVEGRPEIRTIEDGRLFLFPSEKQKKMFERNPDKYTGAELALGGNCPVCLVKMDKLVPGKEEYASVYDGRRYLFPGPEQKAMFDKDPARFAPALGGDCTVCLVEMGETGPGKPAFHLVRNERLFLFPSPKQLKMFKANPEKYAEADLALEGDCVVCKVEMGKEVKGNEDFAVDFRGKRYLFPGRKQLDMFRANPEKYAIE